MFPQSIANEANSKANEASFSGNEANFSENEPNPDGAPRWPSKTTS